MNEKHPSEIDALVDAVVWGLLETDAMNGNHEGTPEFYYVDAENVEYLVRTVLTLARVTSPASTQERPR